MANLTEQLFHHYPSQIAEIIGSAETEITVILKEGVDASFSQKIQDHLVEFIDKQTIVKVNVLDSDQHKIDAFATNQ